MHTFSNLSTGHLMTWTSCLLKVHRYSVSSIALICLAPSEIKENWQGEGGSLFIFVFKLLCKENLTGFLLKKFMLGPGNLYFFF